MSDKKPKNVKKVQAHLAVVQANVDQSELDDELQQEDKDMKEIINDRRTNSNNPKSSK